MKYWTRKMKEWKLMSYLLRNIYIAYRILPPSTTDIIDAPWAGAT